MATEQWKQDNLEKMRAYRREWYRKNKERAKARVVQRRRELREWFNEFKLTLECEGDKCSENHIACLEFHHDDPNEKEMCLSAAVSNGWSRERIMQEAEKCTVLCSNCHRKLHWDSA